MKSHYWLREKEDIERKEVEGWSVAHYWKKVMGDGFEVLEVWIDMRETRTLANEKSESVSTKAILLMYDLD